MMKRPNTPLSRWSRALTIGAACIVGCATQQSPATFDTDRMVADLQMLSADSMEGRFVGSEGGRMANEHIAALFANIGLSRFGAGYTHEFPVVRNEQALIGTNVVGYVEGSEHPQQFIVVTAHYDGLGVRNGEIHNGADDNASGTAALLELARYFAANGSRHSIMFAAFDAEEGGLSGSRVFVDDPPIPWPDMAVNVNMDMISHATDELYVAGTHHYPFLQAYAETAGANAPITVAFGHDRPELGDDDWTNSSDHAPFHAQGIPFLYFGVEDHPDYHRATDDFENVNQAFYRAAGHVILQTILALDADLDAVTAGRGG